MATSLPNPVFATYQPEKAFCSGPDAEGNTLASGEFFTGRWAMWLATVGDGKQLRYKRTSDAFEGVSLTDAGATYTGFSSSELNTPSSNRFDIISFTFTNSGEPVAAIQDRGDNTVGLKNPYEIIVSYSGDKKAMWSGSNPNLFNSSQVNYPFAIPNAVSPIYSTGDLLCYYYKENSTGLYSRKISDGFSTESIAASGLQGGFLTSTRSEVFPLVDTSNLDRSPYINSIVTVDDDGGRIRVLAQKSNINYAFDDFITNLTGVSSDYRSGYGAWKRTTKISETEGQSFYADIFLEDPFEAYQTGFSYSLYALGKTLNKRLFIGLTTGVSIYPDNFFFEDFDIYYTGVTSSFISGVTSRAGARSTGAYTGFSVSAPV